MIDRGDIGCLFWIVVLVLLLGGVQCGDHVYGFNCGDYEPLRFSRPAEETKP